ncbi:MAG: AEC family transporter [Planctomycetota bacterium]
MPGTITLSVVLIIVATAAGYSARRLGILRERASRPIMTLVVVFGYSSIALLTIWQLTLQWQDIWLPMLGALHVAALTGVALLLGRRLFRERRRRGLLAVACAVGNVGPTLGGLVVYLLYGIEGLGLVGIYGLMFTPVTVLLLYPIAKAHQGEGDPLGRIIVRSLLDWRSVALPIALTGVVLSAVGAPYPRLLEHIHLVDILVFLVTAMAYFAIGLRLYVRYVASIKAMIAALSAVRFAGGLGVGLGLYALTRLTPWPLECLPMKVFIIEAFVPTAVTTVALAEMFGLRPRLGSVLFVTNTALYLVLILPLVAWIFGECL